LFSDFSNYNYEQYLAEFSKTRELGALAEHRSVFDSKLELVKAQNAKYAAGESTWWASVNQFTDMSEGEVKRFKGLKKHSNFGLPQSSLMAARLEDLPAQIDWRDKNVVTPVKDQGGCGSCWAFSTAETVESHVAIKTGKLFVLSEQQIVSCATNPQQCGGTGGCEGATQEIGFNYTRDAGGLSLDSEYPYWSGLGIDIPCNQSLVKPVASVDGYYRLDSNNALQLMTAIAQVGPIAISVAASGSFQMYGGGVLSDSGCGWDIDHAVQAVGYGVDATSKQGFWLVRNSWNALWGEGGYIRIFRQTDGKTPEACGTDSTPGDGDGCPGGPSSLQVCGECGILSDSSYPFGGHLA
jgi:cathepsin L